MRAVDVELVRAIVLADVPSLRDPKDKGRPYTVLRGRTLKDVVLTVAVHEGEPLPYFRVADLWNMSRTTASRALRVLKAHGYIIPTSAVQRWSSSGPLPFSYTVNRAKFDRPALVARGDVVSEPVEARRAAQPHIDEPRSGLIPERKRSTRPTIITQRTDILSPTGGR